MPERQLACLRALAAAGQWQELDDPELDAIITMVDSRAATFGNPADADISRLAVGEFRRRFPSPDPNSQRRRATIYSALMATGRVDEAEAEDALHHLHSPEEHIQRRPLAGPVRNSEARFWRFNADGSVLTETSVNLNAGPQIVVYSTPGCGFCKMARAEIAKDPQLEGAVEKYSIWIDIPNINYSKRDYRS